VAFRDGQVSFRYRDNREADAASGRGRTKVLPLAAGEFVRRVLEHVPPPRMHTVRSWGLYASSRRGDLARARTALGQPAPAASPVRVRWQDVLRRIGGDAATRCAVCGAELVTWGHFRRGQTPPSFDAMPRWVATNLHSGGFTSSRAPPVASRAAAAPILRGSPTTG
jgi:hypothetical protein